MPKNSDLHLFLVRFCYCSQQGQSSELLVELQLPKLFELVGLGYSAWFTYRYLLFKVGAGAWRLQQRTGGCTAVPSLPPSLPALSHQLE